MASCANCGVAVSRSGGRGPVPKYCSETCRNRAKWLRQKAANPCPGCGEPMARSSQTSSTEQKCRRCRFGDGAHGTASTYKGGCRCDKCKRYNTIRGRRYAAARRSAGNPIDHRSSRKRESKVCAYCAIDFLGEVGRSQKFCSMACANASQVTCGANQAVRERHRDVGKRGSVRWRALKRANDALLLSGGGRVWVQGPCSVCGDGFLAPGAGARYCSDECRATVRVVPFKIAKSARLAIYDAANWECQLCSSPVRPDEHHNHPRYPTLDHIIPRSLGGSDDPANLRLACRQCNIARGNNVNWVPEIGEVGDGSARKVA